MGLIVCPSCRRHIRTEEKACPFCTPAAVAGGIAIAAMLALAGCGSKAPAAQAPPPSNEIGAGTQPDAGVDQPPPPPDDPYEPRPQPLYGIDRR